MCIFWRFSRLGDSESNLTDNNYNLLWCFWEHNFIDIDDANPKLLSRQVSIYIPYDNGLRHLYIYEEGGVEDGIIR